MNHKDLNFSTDSDYALVIYANPSSDITLQILLTRYTHVLLRLKAQIIFFLCCQNYLSFRTALMNELSSINCGIISLRLSALLEVILYDDKMLNDKSNH